MWLGWRSALRTLVPGCAGGLAPLSVCRSYAMLQIYHRCYQPTMIACCKMVTKSKVVTDPWIEPQTLKEGL